MDDIIPLVRKVVSAHIPPWTVWPRPPCQSVDAYFELCTGLSYDQLWVLINNFKKDHGLARELDSARAKEQAVTMVRGGDMSASKPYDIRKASEKGQDGGDSRSYLLRRIAREAPDVLKAWERGECELPRP